MGIEIYPDNAKYEGSFRNKLKHGKGTFTWTNGDAFLGRFSAKFHHRRGSINIS